VQGYAGIGPSTNQFNGLFLRNASPGTPTTLTLTGLPPHTSITQQGCSAQPGWRLN